MDIKKDINEIQIAIDELTNNLVKEKFNIQDFDSYSKILKKRFFENQSMYETSRFCSFPGCKNLSINRSHSIPKSVVLRNIADNGHLYKPSVDIKNPMNACIMEKIGIQHASVFPGYCTTHEQLFNSFEKDGDIDSTKNALLQTYRDICRERVHREIEKEINNAMKNEYTNILNNESQNFLMTNLKKTDSNVKVTSITIDNADYVQKLINDINSDLTEQIETLKKAEESLLNTLYLGNDEVFGGVTSIDISLPIALCGYASVGYRLDKSIEDNTAIMFLNVIPLKDKTSIVYIAENKYKIIFEKYFDFAFQDPIHLLNAIESFMIYGSDHWFIRPSYWDSFPKEKQTKILTDILKTKDNIFKEYPISIFDDVREQLITYFEKNNSNKKISDEVLAFLNNEKSKINRKIY